MQCPVSLASLPLLIIKYEFSEQNIAHFQHLLKADAILNPSGSSFILSVKVMEQKGAGEKLLKCLPNVNADIEFESLLKVNVSRQSKKKNQI